MMRKRRYTSSTTSRTLKPQRKRFRRSGGLVPTYRGFAPRQFARGEWKYLDTFVSTQVSTTPNLSLLNGIATGTAASQRVGMKVAIRSMELRGYMRITAGAGVPQMHRLLIVLDRQPNGAAPGAITDIVGSANVISLRNLANRKRFKIMYDKVWSFGLFNQGGIEEKHFRAYFKFRRPIIVDFNTGTGGTIADISTNSIYACDIGTVALGATDGQCNMYCRLRYTDM